MLCLGGFTPGAPTVWTHADWGSVNGPEVGLCVVSML